MSHGSSVLQLACDGLAKMDDLNDRFFNVRGKTVILKGWRSLTSINLIAFGCLIAGTIAGIGLGFWFGGYWWFACIAAAVLLAYGIWATYKSVKVRITFSDGFVSIGNAKLEASVYGPFYFTTEASIEGLDDDPGTSALWLTAQQGDTLFVTFMSLSADQESISTCLNSLLYESTHSSV